jgi:hypothetical protein
MTELRQVIIDEYKRVACYSRPNFEALRTRFLQLGITVEQVFEVLGREKAGRVFSGMLPEEGIPVFAGHMGTLERPVGMYEPNDLGDLHTGSSVRQIPRGTARLSRTGRMNFEC